MKLIKPSEISARILTLIDESDEKMIMVSPYMKISKWFKLVNKINGLRTRNINTEIYVRDDPENTATYRDLDQLALGYKRIPNLHSKMYMNEKSGIVSSMNLLLSSEINSLEIGYETESRDEYNDLLGYYYRYIRSREFVHPAKSISHTPTDIRKSMLRIRKELDNSRLNSWLLLTESTLQIISGQNEYRFSINEGTLSISACLIMSPKKNQNIIERIPLILKRIEDLNGMKVSIYPGAEPHFIQLSCEAPHSFKSMSINGLLNDDVADLTASVIKIITATYDPVNPG